MIDWESLKAANAPLNAFLDWDEGASPGEGPLTGITIGVKANIAVAGLPWTAGMALHRDRIAKRDAETVRRLREAGATILGTLNMDEAAFGMETDNPWFGRTQNPHCIGHTPGGSSGGSGAAVAAGLCDVALGTDTGGSIRCPAAFCGVYGFKPAFDAVSREGLELCGPTVDVIGPLARSIDMLERVARVMTDVGRRAGEGRGAIVTNVAEVACDPDVERVYRHAMSALKVTETVTLSNTLARIQTANFLYSARPTASAVAHADQSLLSERFKWLIAHGPDRPAEDWAEDQRVYATTAAEMDAAVERHGFLMLPTTPHPSFVHGAGSGTQGDFCCPANVSGLPAISLPAGWSGDSMPIGIQLVGRRGAEAGLFAIARRVDQLIGAYRPPAGYPV